MEPKYKRRNVRPVHRRPQQDEDPNEILSSIMRPSNSLPHKEVVDEKQAKPKAPRAKKKIPSIRVKLRRPQRRFYYALGILCLTLLTIASYSLISSRLAPTPFTEDLKKSVDFALYYPTELPEDYQLELQSIQKPADDRIFYIISDTDGHSINVTQQKAVEGVNVFEKFASDSEPRKVVTKYGEATVIETDDGVKAGILPIDRTWIFVSMTKDTLNAEQLDAVLKSFRKG